MIAQVAFCMCRGRNFTKEWISGLFNHVWTWWSVHRRERPTSPLSLLCSASCSLLTLKRMNIQHQRHIYSDLSKHPGNMRMRAKTGLISWLDTTAQVPGKDPDITTEPHSRMNLST